MNGVFRSFHWLIALWEVLVLAVSMSSGAEPPQRVSANKPVADVTIQIKRLDGQVADWLASNHESEIALAQLAEEKSTSKAVQHFAKMLETEHSTMLNNLEKFIPKKSDSLVAPAINPSTVPPAEDSLKQVIRDQAAETDQATGAGAPLFETKREAVERIAQDDNAPALETLKAGLPFGDIQREIGRRCLRNAERQWRADNREEREMAFVGQQLVLHEQAIATQQSLRQYASPQLQKVIDSQIEASERHLHEAHSLIASLARESTRNN